MFEKIHLRVVLSLLCCLALILVLTPHRGYGAQVTQPQQDSLNSTQQGSQSPDSNQSGNRSQDRNQTKEGQSDINSNTDVSGQKDEVKPEGLPRTAGELPLLALIGVACLAVAGGCRVAARSKAR